MLNMNSRGNRSVNITKLEALTSQVSELNQFLTERDVTLSHLSQEVDSLKATLHSGLSAQSTLRKHANSNLHLRHCSLIYSMKPKIALIRATMRKSSKQSPISARRNAEKAPSVMTGSKILSSTTWMNLSVFVRMIRVF